MKLNNVKAHKQATNVNTNHIELWSVLWKYQIEYYLEKNLNWSCIMANEQMTYIEPNYF